MPECMHIFACQNMPNCTLGVLSSFEKLFVGLYLIVGELVLVVQKFWLLGFFLCPSVFEENSRGASGL